MKFSIGKREFTSRNGKGNGKKKDRREVVT